MREWWRCRSKRGGWCLPARSVWWWALLLAAFWFGAMTWPLAAEPPSDSPPRSESSTPGSIEALLLLQQADPLLTKLVRLLIDKENGSESLRSSLQSLERQSESDSVERQKQYDELLSKLTASEMERAKLLTLLAGLKSSYERQSEYLEAIQAQAQVVILDYETTLRGERAKVLAWKIGGVTLGVIALAGAAYAGGHLAGWW